MFKESPKNSEVINNYLTDQLHAVKLLVENKLYAQALTIIVSSIDAFGLLDADENEKGSSGKLFKAWTEKYFCINPGIEYSSNDLWAHRCSLLHTYTTTSKLSESGKAKEILFYSGDKFSQKAADFENFALGLNRDRYIAANIEETVLTFAVSCQKFARDLDVQCRKSEYKRARVGKILHKALWE